MVWFTKNIKCFQLSVSFQLFSKAELSACFITDSVDADVLKIRALLFPFFSFLSLSDDFF